MVDRLTLGLDLDLGHMPLAICLNFEILIEKLKYYSVQGSSVAWFKPYLVRRSHYAEIDSFKSDIANISLGIPQGSILGPLLCTIYVNNIQLSSYSFYFIKYADDTTLINITNSSNNDITDQINDELKCIPRVLGYQC